ncbi:MAG: anion permease [Promethearchaeota archaeon]
MSGATAFTIFVIFIVISLLIAFAIGANDETFATVYGSKTLTIREVMILATIFAILGAVILGEAVSETVGKDILIVPKITNAITITVLISTTIWLITSSALGLPISTTHATMGSIIGIGILYGISYNTIGINWFSILEMSFWWILSPIIGYVVTFGAYKLIHKYVINKLQGFKQFEKTEKIFAILLLLTICWTAFSRAGNDCSNAVGIVLGASEGISSNLYLFLLIIGFFFAIGIISLGRGLIKNVGTMTELRPSTAFAAEIPTTIILFIGTLLGIPLSGSHMLVASLIGLAKAQSAPKSKKSKRVILIWFLTFPMAAIVAIVLFFPIDLLLRPFT